MNTNHPGLGEIGTNNFYMLNTQWQSLYNFQERNAYIWTPDIFQGEYSFDWNDAYTRILNANVVIKGIEKVQTDGTSQSNWNNVKGSALFFRAYDFYDLAQEFCKPYIQSTANSDLGIPLRTDPDVSKGSVRASVQETYDQIIHDLLIAKDLLPINPLYKTRPSKPAAYALLARTYLAMENYDRALLYSDSSLQLFSALIDYNTLNASSTLPVPRLNNEVIFHCILENYLAFFTASHVIDSTLYISYDVNDLRRDIFFRIRSGLLVFKGNYNNANGTLFSGLASDETYLIRAECNARKGNTSIAMQDLNTLMIKRWKNNGTFIPFTAINADDALVKILKERRKELIFRALRWTDLRRLNHDPRFAETLLRVINGQTYSLPPNDPKYILPIANDEIQLSGIQQNPR